MMIKYRGDGKFVSFVPNKLYKARKVNNGLGEGWAIYDEGEDWYWYGAEYVEKNFEIATSEDESKFALAV